MLDAPYAGANLPFLWGYLKEVLVKGSGVENGLILLPGNRPELHRIRALLFLDLGDVPKVLGRRVSSSLKHFVVAEGTQQGYTQQCLRISTQKLTSRKSEGRKSMLSICSKDRQQFLHTAVHATS